MLINDFARLAQWLSWLERRPVTAEVTGSSPVWVVWALSSAGRASALQAEGHRFEPYSAHCHDCFTIVTRRYLRQQMLVCFVSTACLLSTTSFGYCTKHNILRILYKAQHPSDIVQSTTSFGCCTNYNIQPRGPAQAPLGLARSKIVPNAAVAELADAQDLKSCEG